MHIFSFTYHTNRTFHAAAQSCLIKRFCEKRFVAKYTPTIGVDYGVTTCVPGPDFAVIQGRLDHGGHVVRLNLFDLSGAADFFEVAVRASPRANIRRRCDKSSIGTRKSCCWCSMQRRRRPSAPCPHGWRSCGARHAR